MVLVAVVVEQDLQEDLGVRVIGIPPGGPQGQLLRVQPVIEVLTLGQRYRLHPKPQVFLPYPVHGVVMGVGDDDGQVLGAPVSGLIQQGSRSGRLEGDRRERQIIAGHSGRQDTAGPLNESGLYRWPEFQCRLASKNAEADRSGEASTYYERWLVSLERLLVEKDLLTSEELEVRIALSYCIKLLESAIDPLRI